MSYARLEFVKYINLYLSSKNEIDYTTRRSTQSNQQTRNKEVIEILRKLDNVLQNKLECLDEDLKQLLNRMSIGVVDLNNALEYILSIPEKINSKLSSEEKKKCMGIKEIFKNECSYLISDLCLKFIESIIIHFNEYPNIYLFNIFKNLNAIANISFQYDIMFFKDKNNEIMLNDVIFEFLEEIIKRNANENNINVYELLFHIINFKEFLFSEGTTTDNNNQSKLQGSEKECKLLNIFNQQYVNWNNYDNGKYWLQCCDHKNNNIETLFYKKDTKDDLEKRCDKILQMCAERKYDSVVTMDGQGRLLYVLCKQIQKKYNNATGTIKIYFYDIDRNNHLWHELFFPKKIVIGNVTIEIQNVFGNIFDHFMIKNINYDHQMKMYIDDFEYKINGDVLNNTCIYLNFCGIGQSYNVLCELLTQLKHTNYEILLSLYTGQGAKKQFYEMFKGFYNVKKCNNFYCRNMQSICEYEISHYNITNREDFRTILVNSYAMLKIDNLPEHEYEDMKCDNFCRICKNTRLTQTEVADEGINQNMLIGGYYKKYMKYVHKNKILLNVK